MLVIGLLFSIVSGIQAQDQSAVKLGYGFSPQGHPADYSQMAAFFQEAANTCDGGVVLANGSWRDSLPISGKIPEVQKVICMLQPSPYPYIDMVVFGWGTSTTPYTLYLDVPGDTTNKWTNNTARDLFLEMLIDAADSLQPTYFFIGNEINFYWEEDSVDYEIWVDFYNQAYDSIKTHSPISKVGTVFNYEHLSGRGKNIGWNTQYWGALDVFDTSRIDILGLTVYPFFYYTTANAVPDDYLEPVFERMGNKPIAITETGWPSDSLLANWYCSPQQQVDYMKKLFAMIDSQNVEVVNWLFLYYLMDQSTGENKFAASISLHDSLGNAQPALPVWLSHCSQTYITENYQEDLNTNYIAYPNPFSTNISIEISDDLYNADLTILDMNGKQIRKQSNIYGKIINVNRDDLPSGVYCIQIKSDDEFLTGKIIVE